MELLKNLFPIKAQAEDMQSLIRAIVIYVIAMVVGAVLGILAGTLFGWIPLIGDIIGAILSIVGWLLDIYCLAGIIISVLVYCRII